MSGVPEFGVPPSLNCAGTGGTGWWYLGPTIQPVSENTAKATTARVHILIPLLHRDAHAVRERIRRIGDHGVGPTDSAHNFDRVAEIMPESYLSKLDLTLTVQHAHLRT